MTILIVCYKFQKILYALFLPSLSSTVNIIRELWNSRNLNDKKKKQNYFQLTKNIASTSNVQKNDFILQKVVRKFSKHPEQEDFIISIIL